MNKSTPQINTIIFKTSYIVNNISIDHTDHFVRSDVMTWAMPIIARNFLVNKIDEELKALD